MCICVVWQLCPKWLSKRDVTCQRVSNFYQFDKRNLRTTFLQECKKSSVRYDHRVGGVMQFQRRQRKEQCHCQHRFNDRVCCTEKSCLFHLVHEERNFYHRKYMWRGRFCQRQRIGRYWVKSCFPPINVVCHWLNSLVVWQHMGFHVVVANVCRW
jgi:hypothetical protein